MAAPADDSNRLKQRLVGATVLIAVMIIFLPMILLDETETNDMSMKELLPPSPYGLRKDILAKDKMTFPKDLEAPIPLPEDTEQTIRNELSRATKIIEQKKDIEAAVEISTPPPKFVAVNPMPNTPQQTTKAQHWAVQVGSFSDPKNAIALRNKLRKQGYAVFIEKHRLKNKNNLRVRVGPMVKKSQAQATQQALEKKQHIEGIITAYP